MWPPTALSRPWGGLASLITSRIGQRCVGFRPRSVKILLMDRIAFDSERKNLGHATSHTAKLMFILLRVFLNLPSFRLGCFRTSTAIGCKGNQRACPRASRWQVKVPPRPPTALAYEPQPSLQADPQFHSPPPPHVTVPDS